MKKKRRRTGGSQAIAIILLIAVLFFPVAAVGQLVTIDCDVEAEGSSTNETIETDIDWDDVYANPDDTYTWVMQDSMSLGNGLGTIESVAISVKADPVIQLGFTVTAGDYATAFSFSSDVLISDPELTNTQGYAYAQIGISTPGANLWGGYGMEAYQALYNGSNLFAELLDASPLTGPGTFDENTGWVAIAGNVSSMQAKWQFTLDAEGMATGSSYYEIAGDPIPEPASILLLGLGGLALLRKRRI